MSSDERIFVGVCRLVLRIPGARSRKDRRQVVRSVRDRLRHRFDVTFHEVDDAADLQQQVVVLTTASNDRRQIRSILDQCVSFVHGHPVAVAQQVDVDVFRWHPSGSEDWASRMMAELSDTDDPPEDPEQAEDTDG
jgi:uncharacterized protein YlxP (DUF503 family)